MAAVVVSTNTNLPQRQVYPQLTVTAIAITCTYSATAYATASGGLPFDLFAFLAQSSNFDSGINYKDIIGFLPTGPTTEKFVLGAFAIGTPTSTTLPCTIRIYGTGSANLAALSEVADANLTGSFSGLLLIARNGAN